MMQRQQKPLSILLAAILLLGLLAIPAGAAGKTEVSLNRLSVTLDIGKSITLEATANPASAKLTWTTDNAAVATVDQSGKVTGVLDGRVRIFATAPDGAKAVCAVTVVSRSALLGANAPIMYTSAYFRDPSSKYLPNIALMSSVLSAAAYNAPKADAVNAALYSLGFDPSTIFNVNYDKVYTESSPRVGATFASRKLVLHNKAYNLIAVVLRGTTGGEWLSNFDIVDPAKAVAGPWDGAHYGFSAAESEIRAALAQYLESAGLTDAQSNKIWITGHSRGGAVANLLAANLSASGKYAPQSNIFAYTFAAPNVDASVKAYGNIVNFVFDEDFVANVPLATWKYARNGEDILLRRSNVSAYALMKTYYAAMAGKSFSAFGQANETATVLGGLQMLAPTVKAYYTVKIDVGNGQSATLAEFFGLIATALASPGGSGDMSALLPYINSTNAQIRALTSYAFTTTGVRAAFADAHGAQTYIAWVKAYNDTK